jgi:hypothetical protein
MCNEDYDRELLVFVALSCGAIAAAVSVFDTSPSAARTTQPAARIEQPALAPARIVGTPFVPNTKPGAR